LPSTQTFTAAFVVVTRIGPISSSLRSCIFRPPPFSTWHPHCSTFWKYCFSIFWSSTFSSPFFDRHVGIHL